MKTPAQIENIIEIIKRNYEGIQMERAALFVTMLLSLCVFSHHAQAMQAVDLENYIDMKKQMDFFMIKAGLTQKQFKEIHFARNNNQKSDVNYSDISASDSGFRKLPPEKSIFHQIGAGNENNEKWTNDKGEEYVFNPSTNPPKLVTNAANIGTYNYIPESDPAGHYLLDVLPYLLWGNSESDLTTFEERFRLFEKAKDETEPVKKVGLGIKGVSRIGATVYTINMTVKKLKNDGIPPQVVARARTIQAEMDIENLYSKGSTLSVRNTSLDYKTLDDSELSKLMLDLNLDNTQEIIDVRNFRFPAGPVNQKQEEEQNTQSFNDDQRIKIADLAVKRRTNAKAEKNLVKRSVTGESKTNSGAGNVLSSADRQKLLSGNYALATFYNPLYSPYSTFRFLGDPYKLSLRNGSSSSLTLRFYQVKESIPNSDSDPAKGNTLVLSDRIKVHAKDYGDYSYIAWGSWSGSKNTRVLPVSGIPRVTSDGHWLYGQKLGRADIPRSGSARYVGQLMGGWRLDTVREMNSITGDINMAVTFRDSNFDLSGAMNLTRNDKAWATARFMHNSNNRVSDTTFLRCCHHFSTSLINANFSDGVISGSFFGANAAEVGGNFYVIKSGKDGGEYAEGIFRAKKQ